VPGPLDVAAARSPLSIGRNLDFNLWVDDFIKGGNTGQPKLKQGQIVYRSPNQKPLLTLDLDNLGIHKYSPAPRVYREDKIATFTVDLHCTKVRAHWGA